jgi:predicted nucleotidyltransferase
MASFGSTACDGSDIDVLVGFDGPATPERDFGVQFFLEDAIGRPIDRVTEKALRKELPAGIVSDAIRV